ncbi:restriction endonuclease [Geomonas sp. Red32]|nr:restriction endonuclease [Geomonas sp. Red32]
MFHALASRPLMRMTSPGNMGEAVPYGSITTVSIFMQWIFPAGFVMGAIVSAISSLKQRKLYEKVQSRPQVGALNELTWEEFESLVGEHFRRDGFTVERMGGNGPDGGIDLVLRRGGEKHLVQCKQWKAYKVGVQPVREFYGVMCAAGAAAGYFVTSGTFTDDAREFVHGLNLDLIDGLGLKKMIGPAKKRGAVPENHGLTKNPEPRSPNPPSIIPVASTPACQKCGAEMKKRIGRQGQNAGKEFWGCSTYPKCNGTRQLEESVPSGAAPERNGDGMKPPPSIRTCPECGKELERKRFLSGPKEGQEFLGCITCKKGWPVDGVPVPEI